MKANPYGQRTDTETAMQMAVIRWARKNAERHPALKWMYHPFNEGKITDPRVKGMRKALGVTAGISDLILMYPSADHQWHGLAVELKKAPNKPTPEQNEFISYLLEAGYLGAVAYSADDAIGIISEYLGMDQAE